jgi:hypothetical protein
MTSTTIFYLLFFGIFAIVYGSFFVQMVKRLVTDFAYMSTGLKWVVIAVDILSLCFFLGFAIFFILMVTRPEDFSGVTTVYWTFGFFFGATLLLSLSSFLKRRFSR